MNSPVPPTASPVLVLNAGSSSLKYQLLVPETGTVLASGVVENIGERGGRVVDHGGALAVMASELTDAGCRPRP